MRKLKKTQIVEGGNSYDGFVGKIHIEYLDGYKRLALADKDYPHSNAVHFNNVGMAQVQKLINILRYNEITPEERAKAKFIEI
jgi:hypothetical protein